MQDGGHRQRMGIELNDRIANEDGRLVYSWFTPEYRRNIADVSL
jgi:hypothetical protein